MNNSTDQAADISITATTITAKATPIMKTITETRRLAILTACLLAFLSEVSLGAVVKPRATRGRQTEVVTELTAKGKELEATYSTMMEQLAAEIKAGVPAINGAHKAPCVAAVKALAEATNTLHSAEGTLIKNQTAISGAGVKAAENDLKVAPVILAAREDMLAWAKALPDSRDDKAALVKSAEDQIKKRTKDVEDAPTLLEKAEANQKQAQADEPGVKAAYQQAVDAYQQALTKAKKALDAAAANGVLASDKLDGKLAAYKILTRGTPRGLAQFAQQSAEHEKLLEQLFSNPSLMIQMVAADGAVWGKYGDAMEIYAAIQKASPRAKEGVLQRMAVAVSLVFAVPMQQENKVADTSAPEFVDPVQRYLSYEKWFLAGELDPAFKDLSTWNLTMTINHDVPDEILAWGREMMKSFRPDLIAIDYKHGRYALAANTEISYGSGDVRLDWDDRNRYQNILANGGICGRRAFFTRYLFKSFGLPSKERPQPGHATLAHWTPDGWQTRLGGNWGRAAWTRYEDGNTHNLNFLAITQARESEEGFRQVLRAQWIGDVMGEEHARGLHGRGGKGSAPIFKEDIGAWYAISFIKQAEVIEELKAAAAAAGKTFGIASTFNNYIEPPVYEVSEADRKIVVDSAGVFTIPAAAARLPDINLAKSGEMGTHVALRFMESNLGGVQLHYGRYSLGTPFTYTIDVPKAGRYALTSRIITPRPKEALTVEVNGVSRVDMPLPYTTGLWGQSEPIVLNLKQGENTLSFSRSWDSAKGITIRDFTLRPLH